MLCLRAAGFSLVGEPAVLCCTSVLLPVLLVAAGSLPELAQAHYVACYHAFSLAATTDVFISMVSLEATNLSEGRGTTRPFRIIGTLWDPPSCTVLRCDCEFRLVCPGCAQLLQRQKLTRCRVAGAPWFDPEQFVTFFTQIRSAFGTAPCGGVFGELFELQSCVSCVSRAWSCFRGCLNLS